MIFGQLASAAIPVNQTEKIDQSDSFLPSKLLAYEKITFFTCWLNKEEINYHEFWE